MEERWLAERLPVRTGDRSEAALNMFEPAASAGLFVGVASFEDERIASVPFAVDDAVDLAHLFSLELGLITVQRTVLLLAGEPRKPDTVERLARLLEKGALRRSARQRDTYAYLGELARGTDAQGLFVLTIATHGVSDQGGDFLVATDSLRERLLRTGVAVAEVFDEVARAEAERRLVLLDACRERLSLGIRGESESAMAQSFVDAIARTRGLVVLSGATLGGFAYDDVVRKNGVFTSAVLDGLHGEAPAGPDGWITVRTLADFVQKQVVAWVRRNRPDHAAISLGIGRWIEATAEALPLAPHPEARRERRGYLARRESALARVKQNQGRVLSEALWDQIEARLPPEEPGPESERLLNEIEALDGSERAQRSLRDFLRELSAGGSSPPSAQPSQALVAALEGKAERNEKAVRAEPTMLASKRTKTGSGEVTDTISWWEKAGWWVGWWAARPVIAVIVGFLVLLMVALMVWVARESAHRSAEPVPSNLRFEPTVR